MADVERDVFGVLDAFMAALNAQDSAGMQATFHFPHYRLSTSGVQVYETADDYGIEVFKNRADTGEWDHSAWDHKRIVHADDNKAHVDVQFTRYRKDGSVIGVYPSLWIVTRIGGRWGVQARSSYAA
ncbi:hypothetical protein ATO6_09175 [Oceanicola sp. 22II-s10i]|uniref:hypothetical protein n=1 Tax=Oceanicola sp. 22II-s10i TaxID=1317116 RepID=UPI000B5283DF|nr:hypothetical protein [Oceanicola sp. 22II-s10i]OWU85196.1 hypothetical protein ATO6_09175 [Oceanicola sp. 22II-s10i]